MHLCLRKRYVPWRVVLSQGAGGIAFASNSSVCLLPPSSPSSPAPPVVPPPTTRTARFPALSPARLYPGGHRCHSCCGNAGTSYFPVGAAGNSFHAAEQWAGGGCSARSRCQRLHGRHRLRCGRSLGRDAASISDESTPGTDSIHTEWTGRGGRQWTPGCLSRGLVVGVVGGSDAEVRGISFVRRR